MVLKRLLHRRRSRSKGQSLVEFALLLPVFLVIVSVALDLGRIASARVTIANVAREASFQAALTPGSYQAGQPCATATNMVICRGILESQGSPVTVNPADITMTCSPSCTGAMGNRVTVTARGNFNLLTPMISVFFGGTSITFTSTATNQISALPVSAAVPTSAPTPTPSPTSTASASPTASPTPSPTPSCASVSAGFTVVLSPISGKSPVTVTVTDTTTYSPACSTVWEWDWDNGPKTYGQAPSPHVYTNNSANDKTFILKLKVTSGTFTSTTGGYSIVVTK